MEKLLSKDWKEKMERLNTSELLAEVKGRNTRTGKQIYHSKMTPKQYLESPHSYQTYEISTCFNIRRCLVLWYKTKAFGCLLIHLSPPLSFAEMLISVQEASLQNSNPISCILRLCMVVSALLLLSLQMVLSFVTLLWHIQSIHVALAIVEPKSVLDVNRARLSWKERGRCRDAHGRLHGELTFEWNILTLTVNALYSVLSTPRQSATQHSHKIYVYEGEGGSRMGRAAAQTLALTVTESGCV